MNRLTRIITLVLFIWCSNVSATTTTLFYSNDFKLIFPSSLFANTTIFSTGSGSVSVKTGENSYFSGQIVDNAFEKLPDSFDIRDYPKYLFLRNKKSEISIDLADSFSRSARALDAQYGLNNLSVTKSNNTTIYSLCSNAECLAFIVKNTLKSHMLSVSSGGMPKEEFKKIIEDNLYVKQ